MQCITRWDLSEDDQTTCAVAVTKKIEIGQRKKIIRGIIGGILYRFLFLFWGAVADWDGQLDHYQGFGVGRGGGGRGYPPSHLFRVNWPKWRQGQWQGKECWVGGW